MYTGCLQLVMFFFSSRRRHTRFSRDWSSDVCSSDLPPGQYIAIETPVSQDQTVTQCSDQPGGTTSTFNLNNVSVTNSANVTITWWENFTSPGTFSRSEERRVGKECRFRWSRKH